MSGEQEELQFNVGDGEEETTVVMNADGGNAKVLGKDDVVAEQGDLPASKKNADDAPDSDELESYSQNVRKRIDKLTARSMRAACRRPTRSCKSATSSPMLLEWAKPVGDWIPRFLR